MAPSPDSALRFSQPFRRGCGEGARAESPAARRPRRAREGPQGLVRQGRFAAGDAVVGADRRGDPAGERLPRLCRLRRGDELGRGGGRPRALARHHRQTMPAPVHSGSRRQKRGLQGTAALRQALPGRPGSARAERRAGEASEGGPRRGLGPAGKAHRRAVRGLEVDARGGGRPVFRPGEGDRGTRGEIPPASRRRHRRRQRDRQIVAGRGGLRPGLSRRRARRSCAQRALRSRLACRHDAAARQSGRGPAPRRHRGGGEARPVARRAREPAQAHRRRRSERDGLRAAMRPAGG